MGFKDKLSGVKAAMSEIEKQFGRGAIMLLGDDRERHRASLKEYSVGFLDQMVGMLAACAIVAASETPVAVSRVMWRLK